MASVYKGIDVMINEVLEAPNLIGTEFALVQAPKGADKRSYDYGLAAAYLITRALFRNRAAEEQQARNYAALLSKYDPFKVSIGELRHDFEARFGPPQITEKLEQGKELRYYGSVKYGFSHGRNLMWYAIVFMNNRVTTILADDFLDQNKIRELEDKLH